jgi:copper(I)-binding protein
MNAIRTFFAATAATLALALPLVAQDQPQAIQIQDAYARAMGGIGKSGAVFFMMHNMTETDDRLVDARADVAKLVQLHTHKDMGDGVMKMMHVPEGFALPAGEMHELARGGDHVMLMGLTRELANGDSFPLTLVFEKAGEVVVDVTVDNDRKPVAGGMGMGNGHGAMNGTNHGG